MPHTVRAEPLPAGSGTGGCQRPRQPGASQPTPRDPIRRAVWAARWAAALTLGQVHLVDQAGQHVAVLDVEVVVGPEDVGGDDGGEGAAVLLEVGPAGAQCPLRPPLWDPSPRPAPASYPRRNPRLAKGGDGAWEPCGGYTLPPPPSALFPPFLAGLSWAGSGRTCSARRSSSWRRSSQNCYCAVARCGSAEAEETAAARPRPRSRPASKPGRASPSHHGFINGVGGLVRKDAGRQAGDHLLCSHLKGRMQDVVVDVNVFPLGGDGRFRPPRQDPSPYLLLQGQKWGHPRACFS